MANFDNLIEITLKGFFSDKYFLGVLAIGLTNFIYQGEVRVDTNDLSRFFEVANDLKIKRLSKSMNDEI